MEPESENETNRREYVRFETNVPLFAELSLRSVGGREMNSRKQRVIIHNVSFGGCCFSTFLRMPVRDDVEWTLKLLLGNYPATLRGVIVHAGEAEGLFNYGVRWALTGLERQTLHYRLNEYVRNVLVGSPHIHTIYKQLTLRYEGGQFKRFDVTS
ncbi:PilZ domain-containing protein [Cohnella suwonensis]|uniref:PilZ domain-containing protein n=1 Tax=Cohnella suwonensis TaxID=696072 RepID=A0ABW0M2Y9_9BACL